MSEILVFSRHEFSTLPGQGAWPLRRWPKTCEWRPRAQVEQDENWLQPIPYALLRSADGRIWCYRRSGGDSRLHDARSCGLGGHVERCDEGASLAQTIAAAMRRELTEELNGGGPFEISPPLAWLYENHSPIGRVHIGLIHLLDWRGPEAPAAASGEALDPIGFFQPDAILADERFELWSRLAVRYTLDSDA